MCGKAYQLVSNPIKLCTFTLSGMIASETSNLNEVHGGEIIKKHKLETSTSLTHEHPTFINQ